jgi:murein L,D-transpeptidase YcbB/YkuD
MRRQCSDGVRQDLGAKPPRLRIAMLRSAIRRIFASIVLLCVLLALQVSDVPAQIVNSPRELAVIRINLLDLLANEPSLPLPIRQRHEALQAYYQTFGGELLWLGSSRADAFISRLRNAEADGLDPNDYPSKQLTTLSATGQSTDKRGLAIIELYFSAAFLEYASDLKVGRFLPSKIDPNFFIEDRTIDQQLALKNLARADGIDGFFDGWQPASPRYAALRTVLAKYRALAAKGGWRTVPLGDAIRPGMTDPRVPAIRARLSLTDGATTELAATEAQVYDNALIEAVKRFQARQGLDVDGVIGSTTIVGMNVPVQERINSIILAMERLRWMPDDLGQQYLIVNIAGFELRRINAGEVEERMAVVVGKPYHRTPVFSDRIRFLELNPYWNVPPNIAINEELPALRRNPASLAAQGFEVVRGEQVIDPRSVDWSSFGAGHFPYQLRQRPGPNNALGRVKFMFPNPHNVYLHDSPAQSLFGRSVRAFSHGCIRLSKPLELAEQVLRVGGVQGWTKDRINNVVASAKTTVVNLREPLPVHITYLTAWADDGVANFRQDIYGHDAKLLAALEGKAIAW